MRALLLIVLLSAVLQAVASPLPAPPCMGLAPPYGIVGPVPGVTVWHTEGLAHWRVPACLSWDPAKPRVVVETAGRFFHEGDAHALLARFGAISGMKGIKYWSVSRRSWKPLFDVVQPLNRTTRAPGADFTVPELLAGDPLLIRQRESHLPGESVLELRVLMANADRIEIAVENVEPIRWMAVQVIAPHGYQFRYIVEREKGSIWRYYNLARLIGGGPALAMVPEASFINRAAAIFRYVAGYPSDTEPPVASTDR